MTKLFVYTEYRERHREIFTVALHPSLFDLCEYETQHCLLSLLKFRYICKRPMKTLKFLPPGSDISDTCTSPQKVLKIFTDERAISDVKKTLTGHHQNAFVEFKNHRNIMGQGCFNGSLHVVFDFAEKEILPN